MFTPLDGWHAPHCMSAFFNPTRDLLLCLSSMSSDFPIGGSEIIPIPSHFRLFVLKLPFSPSYFYLGRFSSPRVELYLNENHAHTPKFKQPSSTNLMAESESTPVQPVSRLVCDVSITVNASWIAILHLVFANLAFLAALAVGWWLHYEKIVQNASYGYPDEWFPSVSAAIGDRYPERSLFQVLIALTSGPRFLLLIFNYLKFKSQGPKMAVTAFICGVVRTFTCGGWVYITSTDDHDAHDVFMIAYIVLTLPWEICTTLLSPKGLTQRRGRFWTSFTFFAMLVPLIYWFIQHKVHIVAGAYSYYAYCEWLLIFLDVAFDTWSVIDFSDLLVTISPTGITLATAVDEPAIEVEVKEEILVVEESTPKKASYELPKLHETAICGETYSTLEFVALCTNYFIAWSVYSSLFLTLWHFPLWDMGISGYEAFVVIYFLASLLVVPSAIRRGLNKIPWITRALTVALGVGAYKVKEPHQKFLTVVTGTAFGTISQVVEFTELLKHPQRYTAHFIAIVVGLLASSVAKYFWFSNNPIWPVMHEANGGLNTVGLFLGLVAAFLTPKASSSVSQNALGPRYTGGSLFFGALGLGGWMYCLMEYMADSGTLVQWVWTGFASQNGEGGAGGPTTIVGGAIHLAAFAIGVYAAAKVDPLVFGQAGYSVVVGGLSAVAFVVVPGWPGFAGATVFTFYIASVSVVIGQSVAGYCPVAVWSLAYMWFVVLNVAGVWTVAYAFVPGGWLLRERIHVLHTAAVVLISLGVLNYSWRTRASRITRLNLGSLRLTGQVLKVLTVLLAALAAVFIRRFPMEAYQPHHDDNFNVGIWCVHFGLDNDMWLSEVRMRDLIRDAELDVVGLLETDTQRNIGGHRDFTQRIAEDLGMYVDYGPGPNKHTWGCALLSKFPILRLTHHLLPLPVGELAPAIHATLDVYGTEVDVVVFHSGQEEDVEDRRLQSLALADIMGSSPRPMVLLSYLVTEPLQGNYFTYSGPTSRMHDIDSTDWDRWCEYIMFRDVKKVAYARISRSTITDTELQVAKFRLLAPDEHDVGEDYLYGNHFVAEEDIPPNYRMPALFRGDGVRGHRYHVFDEPRYFAQLPSILHDKADSEEGE